MAAKYEDFTDCSVCYETMKNPTKLPCDHTFCKVCVDKLCNRQFKTIKCPMDNQMFSSESLRPDFKHAQILELFELSRVCACLQKRSNQLCGLCEENEAKFRCDNCAKNLCRICQKAHAKFYATHAVDTVEDRRQSIKQEMLLVYSEMEKDLVEAEKKKALSVASAKYDYKKCLEDAVQQLDEYEARVVEAIRRKKEQVVLHAHGCIPNGNNLKELALTSILDKATALVFDFKKLLERNPEKAKERSAEIKKKCDTILSSAGLVYCKKFEFIFKFVEPRDIVKFTSTYADREWLEELFHAIGRPRPYPICDGCDTCL